jgi:signal transduction histidine kinase
MYANAASRNLLKAWVRSTGDETLVYWRRLAMETLANGENQMLDIVCDRQVFEFTVVPILESGYVNLYGRDVTERDRVEQALRASEERYQNFISQSFEGISRTEFDQPIDTTLPVETQIDLIYENAYMAECNQALADMYHLPSAESFSGARLIDAHGGKDNPINRAAFRRLIENGYKSMGDETAEYRADGEPIWLLSNTVGTIENSHLVRLWGTALDITERKRADAALRESEQKMRAIVDAAPYGAHLYELHPDERLVFMGANPAADQILHVDHRQFIGRTIEEAFPPLGETEVPAAYRRVAATGEEFQMDQIAYDDAGISGAFELHAFQIGSNQMAVFFHDVTERKKMEEALRRLNEDLELRVVKRTQELAAANARLTELDQLKSKFVSDVSHELRTPIANLKLYIDLLERGKPEKQTQYIQTLHQQVRRVAALVDDILDLSRLEQRKEQGLIYRVVELNDVVGQVVQAHQPRAEADGLQLIFEPATPLPPVRADANQLAQVVTNLVANALSYTTAGYVRVSTFAQDAEVCLCVADSGSGIALEDLPHVFDRFYRGQYVLKNDVPGTGLGLAIVKEIVDLHEGRIEVDSQPDRGTTFRVWLPVVQNT